MWTMKGRLASAAGVAAAAVAAWAAGIALAAGAGSFDRSFGDGGRAVVANPDASNTVSGAAVDERGRILTAGTRRNVIELTRLLPDGTPDSSFGSGGQAIAEFGEPDAVANDVVGSGDLILASGFTGFDGGDSDSYYRFLVGAFTEDGDPAAAFGDDGAAVVPFGNLDIANAVTADSGGRIVAGGETAHGIVAPDDMAMAVLTPEGELDAGFSGDGRWTWGRRRADEEILDVAVDRSGRVLFAGFGSADGRTHMIVGRLRRDGELDRNFGRRGIVRAFVDSPSAATSVHVDRLDRPVIAGYVHRGEGERFALARFRYLSGRFDRRFGGDGQLTLDPPGVGGAAGIVPGRGGRLVVAGNTKTGRDSTSDMLVTQITAKGALDTGFGRDGWRRIDFDGGRDVAAAVLASAGRILVAGTADISPATGRRQNEVAVAALKR
jgi:uncharacterized delta-60 repeat protein